MEIPQALFLALAFAVAVGSALIGGVFFAFSTFIIKGLRRIPASAGIAAMQSINVVVINPWFLGPFLGTAALSALAVVGALARWEGPGAGWLLAGSVLYVAGTFLVTMLCNVPLNNALAAVAPSDPDAPRQWDHYCRRWMAWNHVRSAAALAAAVSFVMALR